MKDLLINIDLVAKKNTIIFSFYLLNKKVLVHLHPFLRGSSLK